MAKKKKSGSKQKKNGASASGANTEEATKANVKAESEVEAGHVQTSNESHTQETAQESAANGKPSQPVLSDDGDAKQLAEAEKDAGNAALKKGELQKAIDHYTKAFELNPSHVYLSNRSAAHLSLGNLEAAKKDAQACVEANPEWAKGYSRLGTALHYLKDFKGATQAYASGLVKDPSNSALLQGLSAAQKSLTDDDVAAAAGNPSDSTGKSTPTPTPTPTPTTGMQEVSSPVDASASASTSTSASTTASSKSDASTISKKDDSRPHQEDNAQGSVVIGIDLGTTYSCVGVWRDGNVEIIPDEEGRRTTPSIVAFTEEGTRLVGYSARSQASRNSRNTVYDVKRLLGQRVTDTQVARDIKRFPFEVIKGKDDAPLIRIQEKQQYQQLKPEQISGLVLGKMKTIAENYLGHPVSKAVVTVPAYFSDAQRQATKNAGAIAGLEVLRIINEPTAAALAYGLDLKAGNKAAHEEARNILVFDLGGGTFDVSILQIEGGIFEVLATGGDTHLGGEDFDGAVEDHLLEEAITKLLGGQGNKGLRKEKREELKQDLRAMKRLRVAAEQAKRELSTGSTASIMLDGFLGKEKQDFHVKLTRAKFEKINEEPFNRCMKTVKRVMQDAKLQTKAIDDVVLVGGSTRIPAIQEMLSKYFGAKDLCKSINPDEAVAYGAAVQGAILGGVRHSAMQQLLLVDVTPLSLGIELTGRVFSTVIPRNTQLPVSRAKTYTTEEDNQTGIDVLVFEGERSSTDSNNLLGQFEITGIQRAPRGVPQIEVRFTVDTNGILNVEALDKVTQARAQTTISAGSGRLSQEEIDRMVRDAQLHEEEDRIRLEQAGDLY